MNDDGRTGQTKPDDGGGGGGGLVGGGLVAGGLVAGGVVAGGLVGMQVDKMRWPRPTRPGDTLKVTLEVLKAKRSTTQPEFGVVGWRWTTTNQAGETAMTLENAIWVPCRPH